MCVGCDNPQCQFGCLLAQRLRERELGETFEQPEPQKKSWFQQLLKLID